MATFFLEYDSSTPSRQRYNLEELRRTYVETGQWGLSTHIDLGECDAEAIRNPETIKEFTIKLSDHICMKRFPPDEDPIIVRFGEDPVVTGYTMVQLIETSDITAHFAEDENGIYLCIFSCKFFDPISAAWFAAEFFRALAGFTLVCLFRKAPKRLTVESSTT